MTSRRAGGADQPQLTSDARASPGTTPTVAVNTTTPAACGAARTSTRAGRRSTRTTCAASCCGSRSRTAPSRRPTTTRRTSARAARTRSRPATSSRSSAARRRPRRGPRSTRWASATRSASRWTRTTSRTSATTRRTRRCRSSSAGRRAWAGSRSSASRRTTAGRSATGPASRTTAGTSTPSTPLDATPQPFDCAEPTRVPNDSTGTSTAARAVEPGLAQVPAAHQAGHLVLVRDNTRPTRWGRRASATTGRTRGPTRARGRPRLPAAVPRAYTGGVGPHGIAKYEYDPANPNTKKFPPYYDNSVILGEFTQDTLREIKLDSQNRIFKINKFLPCGAAHQPDPAFPFECDNPMDMQWGADG